MSSGRAFRPTLSEIHPGNCQLIVFTLSNKRGSTGPSRVFLKMASSDLAVDAVPSSLRGGGEPFRIILASSLVPTKDGRGSTGSSFCDASDSDRELFSFSFTLLGLGGPFEAVPLRSKFILIGNETARRHGTAEARSPVFSAVSGNSFPDPHELH